MEYPYGERIMKFKAPAFLAPYIAKTAVLAGRFLPINNVTGVGLLMATVMGDVANVRRLCKKVRAEKLPLSLQHAILRESIGNILLLNDWQPRNGVNRPQEREALDTFDCVSSVVWDITPQDSNSLLDELVNEDYYIPESVDVGGVAVKLCTRQNWPAEHKCVVFSGLCHQVANSMMAKYGPSQERLPDWALSDIYQNWKLDLKADALVPSLVSDNPFIPKSEKRKSFTLLERCVLGAPDRVLIDMVEQCVSPNTLTKSCGLFERPHLNEDILYAFIKKGMDVNAALEQKYGYRNPNATVVDLENELGDYSLEALHALKNAQLRVASENQKAVLIEAVEDMVQVDSVVSVAHRRKM